MSASSMQETTAPGYGLIPHPCAIVTTTVDGVDYGCTVAWSMWTSFAPPLLTVSIGHTRFTHDKIVAAQKFGVSFLSETQKPLGVHFGSVSSRNQNKFASPVVVGKTFRGKAVDIPLFLGSSSCFECTVENSVTAGDHTLFVGRVHKTYSGVVYQDDGLWTDTDMRKGTRMTTCYEVIAIPELKCASGCGEPEQRFTHLAQIIRETSTSDDSGGSRGVITFKYCNARSPLCCYDQVLPPSAKSCIYTRLSTPISVTHLLESILLKRRHGQHHSSIPNTQCHQATWTWTKPPPSHKGPPDTLHTQNEPQRPLPSCHCHIHPCRRHCPPSTLPTLTSCMNAGWALVIAAAGDIFPHLGCEEIWKQLISSAVQVVGRIPRLCCTSSFREINESIRDLRCHTSIAENQEKEKVINVRDIIRRLGVMSGMSSYSGESYSSSAYSEDTATWAFNILLFFCYLVLLLGCGVAMSVHLWRKRFRVSLKGGDLVFFTLVSLSLTCVLRVVGLVAQIAHKLDVIFVQGNFPACLFYTTVWLMALALYTKFHPLYSPANEGGVPWKWKYIAFGANISLYAVELSITIVLSIFSASDKWDQQCRNKSEAISATMNLVLCIGYAGVSFIVFKVTIECWTELILKKYKKLLPELIIVGVGCTYRALNDVISAIFPYWILSVSQNNYTIFIKELIPAVMILVAMMMMSPKKQFEQRELEELEVDPAFKRIDFASLSDEKPIGEGASGSVSSCIWKVRGKEIPVALKRVRLSEDMKQELIRLGNLWHPNIINFHGYTRDLEGTPGIVIDLAIGSLDVILRRDVLKWSKRFYMLLDVAQGMAHIHSVGLLHRDLKPQNILVDVNGTCKICDFGTSTTDTSLKAVVGTPGYIAPEVELGRGFSQKSDVYSFAMVFWFIITNGRPLYPELLSDHERTLSIIHAQRDIAIHNDNRPEIPANLPPELGELLKKCWDADPSRRPSFRVIVHTLRAYRAAHKQARAAANAPTPQPSSSNSQSLFPYAASVQAPEDVALLSGDVGSTTLRVSDFFSTQKLE
ncbi:TKL protein kinase [Pelomyxa schiedti]|nr:TKL protein kinase [Pelomyxa schiedti]